MNKIHGVRVELGPRSYDILIGRGLRAEFSSACAGLLDKRRALVITDSNVNNLYGSEFLEQLKLSKIDNFGLFVYEAGEQSKTLATVEAIYHSCLEGAMDRKSLIIAFGGGVCGDMAGFAAATFMRGIDFIQLPTTLLAMVDSSVGGKTGVDLSEGKNLVGAFHQPETVIIDPEFIDTLSEEQLRCGLAEVVKYGVIYDADFFALLEENIEKILERDLKLYEKIIARCCEIKAAVVAGDETEQSLRAILNYGHTFAHAIEKLSDFAISHGEAVASGMNMAAFLAVQEGMLDAESYQRQVMLLEKLSLGAKVPFKAEDICKAMLTDKKTVSGTIHLVLPQKIGKVKIFGDRSRKNILKAIGEYCND